ncbi:MAG: flippase [Candidatus Omnitrophica bacterium]|nr:flippase [Candidatus Omnitrophota bacterium]MDD5552844.1 flippase [Candidatus Omnitrophota bacterium]
MKIEIKDNLSSITTQAGVVFIGVILENIFKYIYNILLARLLGPELVGLYFLGLIVIGFAAILGKFGLDAGILRYASMYKVNNINKAKAILFKGIRLGICLSFITSIGILFASKGIALKLFKNASIINIIQYLAFSIPLSTILMLALSYFQAFRTLKYNVLIQNILQPLSNILLFVILFYFGLRINAAVFSYLAALLIALWAAFYFLHKRFKVFAMDKISLLNSHDFLKYSFSMFAILIFNYLYRWIDTLMLGYFRPTYDVGIYNIALRTSVLCSIFFVPFTSVFSPIVSELYEKDRIDELKHIFKVVTRWLFSLTVPLFLIFSFYANRILNIFGREFVIGSNAFIILSFSLLISSATDAIGACILVMLGRTKIIFINMVTLIIISIILNYILIPKFGILGAAIVNSLSIILMGLLIILEVRYLYGFHPYSLKFFKPLWAGMVSFCILYLSKALIVKSPWFILAQAAFFIFTYMFILGFNEDDKVAVRIIANRLKLIFT